MDLSPEETAALRLVFALKPWGKDKIARATARYLDGNNHALDSAPTLRDELQKAIKAVEGRREYNSWFESH